jgi:uncharacterized protein (DUF58 family)
VKGLLDVALVERAAAGLGLRLPRTPHRGRLGEVRAASLGSALELHDFREYQPGDDVRHLDWNAVARTGKLVVRVRHDEVSPRVEVVLDGSASMAVAPEKAARARELALWLCLLARNSGLEPTLLVAGAEPQKVEAGLAPELLRRLSFDGRESFDAALRRAPPLRPCGVRVVVSDWLFEAPVEALATRLARGAASLALLQVLGLEDADPTIAMGVRLVDSETGEALERVLTSAVVAEYQARLGAHVGLWRSGARRVRAEFLQVSAEVPLSGVVQGPLASLWEVGR